MRIKIQWNSLFPLSMPYVTTLQYREIFWQKWQPPIWLGYRKAGVLHAAPTPPTVVAQAWYYIKSIVVLLLINTSTSVFPSPLILDHSLEHDYIFQVFTMYIKLEVHVLKEFVDTSTWILFYETYMQTCVKCMQLFGDVKEKKSKSKITLMMNA